MIKIATEIISK